MIKKFFGTTLALILLLVGVHCQARSVRNNFVERALASVGAPVLHTIEGIHIDWNKPDTNKARKAAIPARRPGSLRDQDPEYIRWHKAHTATQVANIGGMLMATGSIALIGALVYNDMSHKRRSGATPDMVIAGTGVLLVITGLVMMVSGSEVAKLYRPSGRRKPKIRE
jgi:hypothetical protein